MDGPDKENNMEIGLIIYAAMMSIVVLFVIAEYLIGTKLKDENKFKKWWRQNVVGDWKSNHPKV